MKRLTRFVLSALTVSGIALGVRNTHAANTAGNPDTTFGTKGVTVTTLTNASENSGVVPYSVKLQADGRIVVLVDVMGTNSSGAFTTTDVLRYTSGGVLDSSFGSKGIAVLPTTVFAAASLALQPNGQLVITGYSGFDGSAIDVQRLNTNGTVDTTFGKDGLAIASLGNRGTGTELVALIETNNEILTCGQLEPTGRRQPFQTVIARFNADGALDTAFGAQGTTIATAVAGCAAVAELSTGEILIENGPSAQFTANGALESTVTGGTIVASAGSENPSVISIFEASGDYLAAQPAFVGEESRGHNAAVEVLRFTSTGSQDPTFPDPQFHFAGSGGSGIEAIPNALAVQSNGDIVVVGLQSTSAQSGTTVVNGLARLTSAGTLDPAFGVNGTVTNSIPEGTQGLDGVAIQPADGKIVTIGVANADTALTVSRYLGQ